jgi:hypothetical protein
MSYVIVANGTASSTTLLVDDVELALQFTDHFSLIRQLIATCDGCLLVAPFLYEDFNVIFDDLAISNVEFELISSCATRILDIVPDERIINSYVLSAAGERFSVSLSTVELLPDGTGTLMRVTEHGAYFDGNPEGPKMRVHGIGEQL